MFLKVDDVASCPFTWKFSCSCCHNISICQKSSIRSIYKVHICREKEKYILLILISCCTVYKSVFKSYFSSETETPSLKKVCEEYADFVVENTEAADMKKE